MQQCKSYNPAWHFEENSDICHSINSQDNGRRQVFKCQLPLKSQTTVKQMQMDSFCFVCRFSWPAHLMRIETVFNIEWIHRPRKVHHVKTIKRQISALDIQPGAVVKLKQTEVAHPLLALVECGLDEQTILPVGHNRSFHGHIMCD